MARERPHIVVVRQHSGHGCIITLLLLILAWPLAIVYWILRLIAWMVGLLVDVLTLGRIRHRRP